MSPTQGSPPPRFPLFESHRLSWQWRATRTPSIFPHFRWRRGVGFEPTVPLPRRMLSKHVDSSTLAPLRDRTTSKGGILSRRPVGGKVRDAALPSGLISKRYGGDHGVVFDQDGREARPIAAIDRFRAHSYTAGPFQRRYVMKILVGIGVVILLLLILIIALPFLIDLNKYQDRYRPLIEEALNRKVELQDIRLTIWPASGLGSAGLLSG